jgi:RNA polymerase sigma-70 factor (ECF subfamily)
MRAVVQVPQDWIRRSQAGEGLYFDRLVEAYQAPVYNLCLRMLGNPGEAEDAAQETFWRAYRGLRRYDPRRPFGTWLLAIAAHHCIDRLRRRSAPLLSLEGLRPPQEPRDPALGPEPSIESGERDQALGKLLLKLDPEDRTVLVMRYWYDMSYEEMSQVLSVSTSAVKSRLHRARRTLADQWSVRQEEEDPPRRLPNAAPAF